MAEDVPKPPADPKARPSGQQPRLFFEGEDKTIFLQQLREMASDCAETKRLLRERVSPLTERMALAERNIEEMKSRTDSQTSNRLDELDRKMAIIIADRVELTRVRDQVKKMQGRRVGRALALVALVMVAAFGASGVTIWYFTSHNRAAAASLR